MGASPDFAAKVPAIPDGSLYRFSFRRFECGNEVIFDTQREMVTMMRLLAAVPVIIAVGALAVGTAPSADAGTARPRLPCTEPGRNCPQRQSSRCRAAW